MIRDRREEDVDRLARVLETVDGAPALLAGRDARAWLLEHDGVATWVYDMAPVRVAPTRNVVAHVQVHRPDPSVVEEPLARLGRPADGALAIGKLFVRPDTFVHGIGRHLLKEAAAFVRAEGKVPVVGPEGRALLPSALFERGFEEAAGAGGHWFPRRPAAGRPLR